MSDNVINIAFILIYKKKNLNNLMATFDNINFLQFFCLVRSTEEEIENCFPNEFLTRNCEYLIGGELKN